MSLTERQGRAPCVAFEELDEVGRLGEPELVSDLRSCRFAVNEETFSFQRHSAVDLRLGCVAGRGYARAR